MSMVVRRVNVTFLHLVKRRRATLTFIVSSALKMEKMAVRPASVVKKESAMNLFVKCTVSSERRLTKMDANTASVILTLAK